MHRLLYVLNSAAKICRTLYPRVCAGALFVVFIVIITPILIFPSDVHAAQTVPYKMNFQGRLTDSNGNVPADGKYNMRLRLMSASSGGTNLWQSDRIYNTSAATDYRVEITNGLFSIQLGEVASGVANDPALDPGIFNTQTNATLYLEVELPTPGTADCATNGCQSWSEGPMTPRQLISSAPYALNSDTIDGIDGASLAQLSANNTFTGTNLFKNTSNSTTAFQIQKSDSTPLLVADTQNLALKVGGGDVSPDASPALLVLDYKNTSGDPSGVNGAMYYNSTTNKYRCYENSEWKDCIYDDPFMREKYTYKQDFMPGISLTPPIFTASNSAVVDSTLSAYTNNDNSFISNPGSEVGRLGIWRFNTGTTTNGNAFVSSPLIGSSLSYPYRLGEGEWTFATSVRITNVSAVGNLFNAYFGLTGSSISPASGCTFRYSIADYNGDWAGVCGNGTTESKCPITDTPGTPGTRAVVAGTWYGLRYTVNSAGTLVTFSATNGSTTYSCTVSTTIPTAANLSLTIGILKSTGTTARTMDVDYLDITYNTSNR